LAGGQVLEVGMSRVVLVVDDDPLVLDVTTHMLEDLGCDVVTAGSGREALALLSDNRQIEVLITDLNMPEMDGYELADQAARRRPDLRIPLLSGREGDGHGLPILRKPFLEDDLARTMSQTTGLC
jgi:CheY-like chemotaxis protein